ncbi:hypothetical protein IWZ00DRAFT_577928 [Phyllosticta capitalensis]|uniref:uncharacterized protein n=1 Tax=Phyllosticta capitalensis TaxID=121624 RepID=UPI00312EF061
MLFQTEEQALSFLTSHSTSYHLTLFAPAATRIYAIDGLLFSFLLERGLPFAVAADVPLLSPRVKLDQLTRLVDAAHAYQRKHRSLARFVAAVGGLDGDLLSVLKRVVRGEEEEFGGEVEAVAKVCFAAMERERDNTNTNTTNKNKPAAPAAAWTLPELLAALNDELSTFWANEKKRAEQLNNPPGFSRQAKFDLQAIFDEEDRAEAEAQEAKRRAEEQRQQEWVREQMRICAQEERERERQRQEQEQWRRFCEMERQGELGPTSPFGQWLLREQQQGRVGQGQMMQMQMQQGQMGQMGQQGQFGQLQQQQQQGQMVQGQMGMRQQGMGQMGMGQGHGQQRGGG